MPPGCMSDADGCFSLESPGGVGAVACPEFEVVGELATTPLATLRGKIGHLATDRTATLSVALVRNNRAGEARERLKS